MLEMRRQFRSFKDFVDANYGRQNNAVKYIVTNSDIEAADTNEFAFVVLYESAFATAFKLPDQPSGLQASVLSCNSLQLKWNKPKCGAESVNSYTLLYHSKSDPPDQWFPQTTPDAEQQFVLSGLVPGTIYCLKVRAESTPGCSQDSKECETTLPPNEPGKPHASNITHNSLRLTWKKPKHGAELVQSYTITFHSPGVKTVTVTSTCTQQEYADLSGLTPNTIYTFNVRAESVAGSSPDSET